MNFTASIATAALLTAALNVAVAHAAPADAFADSTGGSSQIHGELADTPAGIVPVASSRYPTLTARVAAPYADSTGGVSTARAAALLAHASAAPRAQASARGRFQPYADSTGGASDASVAHALATVGAPATRHADAATASDRS